MNRLILTFTYVTIAMFINIAAYFFCFNLSTYYINSNAEKIKNEIIKYYEIRASTKSLPTKLFGFFFRNIVDYKMYLVMSVDEELKNYLKNEDFGTVNFPFRFVHSIENENLQQFNEKEHKLLTKSKVLPINCNNKQVGKMCLILLASNPDLSPDGLINEPPSGPFYDFFNFLVPYKYFFEKILSSREYTDHKDLLYRLFFITILALTTLPVILYMINQQEPDQHFRFEKKNKKDSPYKILKSLYNKGRFTHIYLANDTRLERNVVIKGIKCIYPFEKIDPNVKMMMTQEYNVLERNKHVNIVEVYQFEEKIGNLEYCIVMEFINGETLASIVKVLNKKREKLEDKYVIYIIIEICEGLQKCHSNNFYHKDINPTNIMISKEGKVVIIDFGCSQLSSDTKIIPKGTKGYWSPEHLNNKNIDQQSDIFSLGIMFYELLCGKKPKFKPGKEITTIIEINEHLTEKINDVVMKCLEPDRNKRYKTVDDIITTLKSLRNKYQIHCTKDDMAIFMKNFLRKGKTKRLQELKSF